MTRSPIASTASLDRGIPSYRMLIGGEWVSSQRTIESFNPYDRKMWARIPAADEHQVDAAVRAARRAFADWGRSSGLQRSQLMNRFADLIVRDAARLGKIETTDNGKIIRETERQMHFSARNYRFFAGYADKIYGNVIPLDNTNLFDYSLREPIGVAALLVAWNSPVQLLTNKLAPALAAGCSVVIKPSEEASATILEIASLAEEAGFPKGVINVVTGDASTGRALTEHPDVNRVSFTGGVETGRLVARAAAANLVPTTLELGGKSANIIFADANIEAAVSGALAGIFGAGGQSCIAGSRLLVERPVYDHVLNAVAERARNIKLGAPLDPATEMGPVANIHQFQRILGLIEEGKASGARLLVGGEAASEGDLAAGYFIKPTIFCDVSPDSKIAQEEIFGPVLAVIPFDSEAEAVEIANNTRFGLASGLWTQDLSRAHRVARQIQAGTVWINTYRTNAAQAPFGGYKQSGYGRERGLEALEEYLVVKNVMIDLAGRIDDPFSMRV